MGLGKQHVFQFFYGKVKLCQIQQKRWVVYLSTSGNTKVISDAIANGISEQNVEATSISFYDVKLEDLKATDAIAVGSSTFHYKILPPMEKFIDEVPANSDVKGKLAAAFGSYGWSDEAPILIAEKLRNLGMNVIDPVLRIQYKPIDRDIKEAERLGMDIAEKLKNA
ncbi:MAG: FprA family A-type flavoprotein [Methanosarcinaceae archaeon]|nr:FprA family A-type flavoprotein [Methanosarcinaceae archaeon]